MAGVGWSYRADYMRERHGIETEWSVRTIGNSTSAGYLVTVITVEEAGTTWSVNGWKSSEIDLRRYREEHP